MAPKAVNGDLYHQLRKLWKESQPFKPVGEMEKAFQEFWKEFKTNRDELTAKINYLEIKKRSLKDNIFQGFARQVKSLTKPTVTVIHPPEAVAIPPQLAPENVTPDAEIETIQTVDMTEDTSVPISSAPRFSYAQDKIKTEISQINERIIQLTAAKDAGLLSDEHRVELKQIKNLAGIKRKRLLRLQKCQRASSKYRGRRSQIIKALKNQHPEILDTVHFQNTVGRPPLERDFPDLQDTIIKLVTQHCSAADCRRSDTLRCFKTLDDLVGGLQEKGINISRSGLYLRFRPRNETTREGKLHTSTVPVKLIRAQNSLRRCHADEHFAAATVRYLKDLARTFGDSSVMVLSQDDKARVPLGLPAANKQGPILMRMDYRVLLPDHDWVIATKHKLIPSVYAALQVKPEGVSYSGPTYIAIRSGKHDKSTAFSHAKDLSNVLQLDSFKLFARIEAGIVKPIWILLVDGGPDENPRFPKTLLYAAQHFKYQNLDAIFIATHAPHQSASNPVERRMAPLSRDLCGLILPHDSFGNHLDNSGRTIDHNLEVTNFEKAGKILAEVWSQRIIDGFPVIAEFISPPIGLPSGTDTVPCTSSTHEDYVQEQEPEFFTEEWKSVHVRQSQYLLQIVKCGVSSCCGETRTNIRQFFRGLFLPSPVKFIKTPAGVQLQDAGSDKGTFLDLSSRLCFGFLVPQNIPFDAYCPSVKDTLSGRICQICHQYFVTKKAMLTHKKLHRLEVFQADLKEVTEEEAELQYAEDVQGEDIFQIPDLVTWAVSPFTED